MGALVRRNARELVLSLSLPHKNAVRRQPCASQEKGLLLEPDHTGTLILDTQALELEKSISVVETPRPWCLWVSMAGSIEDKSSNDSKCFSATIISHQHIL